MFRLLCRTRESSDLENIQVVADDFLQEPPMIIAFPLNYCTEYQDKFLRGEWCSN